MQITWGGGTWKSENLIRCHYDNTDVEAGQQMVRTGPRATSMIMTTILLMMMLANCTAEDGDDYNDDNSKENEDNDAKLQQQVVRTEAGGI